MASSVTSAPSSQNQATSEEDSKSPPGATTGATFGSTMATTLINGANAIRENVQQTSRSKIALIAFGVIASLALIFHEINTGGVSLAIAIVLENPILVAYMLTFIAGMGLVFFLMRPTKIVYDDLGNATEKLLIAEKKHEVILNSFNTVSAEYATTCNKLQTATEVASVTADCHASALVRINSLKESRIHSKTELKALDQLIQGYADAEKTAQKQKGELLKRQTHLYQRYHALEEALKISQETIDQAYAALELAGKDLSSTPPTGKIDSPYSYLKPYQIYLRVMLKVTLIATGIISVALIELKYGILKSAFTYTAITLIENPHLVLFTLTFVLGAATMFVIQRILISREDPLEIATKNYQKIKQLCSSLSSEYEKKKELQAQLLSSKILYDGQLPIAKNAYDFAKTTSKDQAHIEKLLKERDLAEQDAQKASQEYHQITVEFGIFQEKYKTLQSSYDDAYRTLQLEIENAKPAPLPEFLTLDTHLENNESKKEEIALIE